MPERLKRSAMPSERYFCRAILIRWRLPTAGYKASTSISTIEPGACLVDWRKAPPQYMLQLDPDEHMREWRKSVAITFRNKAVEAKI